MTIARRLTGLILASLLIATGIRIAARPRSAPAHVRVQRPAVVRPSAPQPTPEPVVTRIELPPAFHESVDVPKEDLAIPSAPWPIRELDKSTTTLQSFEGRFGVVRKADGKLDLVVAEGHFSSDNWRVDRQELVRVHPLVSVLDGSPDVRRLVAVPTRDGIDWRYGFLFEGDLVSHDHPTAPWRRTGKDNLPDGVLAQWICVLEKGQYTDTLLAEFPNKSKKWIIRFHASPADAWINGYKLTLGASGFPDVDWDSILGTQSTISVRIFLYTDAQGSQPDPPGEHFPVDFRFLK